MKRLWLKFLLKLLLDSFSTKNLVERKIQVQFQLGCSLS